MTRTFRTTPALIWLAVPPLLLSALVHMADPDIDGWRGLTSSSALSSVALVGLLLWPLFFLCLRALLAAGRSGFLITAGSFSVCLGLVLTILGSGATTTVGRIETFAACTGVVLFLILAAVLPAAALGWPRAVSAGREERRA